MEIILIALGILIWSVVCPVIVYGIVFADLSRFGRRKALTIVGAAVCAMMAIVTGLFGVLGTLIISGYPPKHGLKWK
jgi:hypothetical protein